MILLHSKTFKNYQKLLKNFVHFWVSPAKLSEKFSNYLKTTLDPLKVEKQFTRNKSTQGKKETAKTFAIRFPCANKIYKLSPKYSK